MPSRTTKPLAPPDTHHLQAAAGWLDLGNHLEANAELDKITPELRAHPDVLELRWHVFKMGKKWEACLEISRTLMAMRPDDPEYRIWHGNALYWSGETQSAYDFGLTAIERFPQNWMLHFNLACYACQLGRLDEAKRALSQAIELGDSAIVKLKALDDPDLEPLWRRIGEL